MSAMISINKRQAFSVIDYSNWDQKPNHGPVPPKKKS